jgi:hypothetical protein
MKAFRVWNGIIDAFGRGEIGPLLGARRKDMPGIFDDERRGSGPIAPDPRGDGANSRQGRVADGSWGPHPTAPPAPNPGGNSLPPNVSIIPFQTLILILVLGGLLAASVLGAVAVWNAIGGIELSGHGLAALVLGALVSLALGGGLMFLVFYSSRQGHDDDAAGR